jgi:hypothetical protein
MCLAVLCSLSSSIELRAQIIATLIYLVIASAGYLMFGDFVSDEVRVVHSQASLSYPPLRRSV